MAARKKTAERAQPAAPRPNSDAEALVLFTDIRGFTRWSEANEVFARLDTFASRFIAIIREAFPQPTHVKALGDGAMIVQVYPGGETDLHGLLETAMTGIQRVNVAFQSLCGEFARTVGHATELQLGWGVVRGAVKVLDGDFVGSNLNKSARLCDVARPFGIVIDRDDFPDPPNVPGLPFFEQTRKLSGISDNVRIWATKEIVSSFVTRERLKETPEVHVAGMCIDSNDRRGVRILIARRAANRRLYPNLYEGCGGQLAYSESFAAGVERHFKLEMGIEVKVDPVIHCFYEIKESQEPLIPGIRFLCHRVNDSDPRSSNHGEIRWVSETELRRMDSAQFIPGLKDDYLKLLDQYHESRKPRKPAK